MKIDKNKIIGSQVELVVKETSVEQRGTDVVVISGYANRYLDDNGKLVVDRSEESVLPQGYDLKDYMKNPILLYSHDKQKPIGKIINIDIRVDGLYIEAEVHKFMNDKAYYGVLNGILKTFSIGFQILDYAEVDGVYLWTQTKLLEVSIVSVPDNQDSIFTVLTDAPCQSGVCLLGSKAISKETIRVKQAELKTKEWRTIDKQVMKDTLVDIAKEDFISDSYLIVKDVKDAETWKFPHHELIDGKLILNKGGLISAFSALKGVQDDDILSVDEKLVAAEHLKGHFQELFEDGLIEEAMLQNLDEFVAGLEESKKDTEEMKTKETEATETQEETVVTTEEGTETTEDATVTKETEETEVTTEQSSEETTINTSEGTEQDNDTQNPDNGEGNTKSDSGKIGLSDIESFIGSAKQTPEGVEQLFVLYAGLADTLNEVLTDNKNEE